MKQILEKINELKLIIGVSISVMIVLSWGWNVMSDASEAKKKVETLEQTTQAIKDIATQVQANQIALGDPKRMLRDHLITMGEDPQQVKYWMTLPLGVEALRYQDTLYLLDVPFISVEDGYPIIGIRAMLKKADTVAVYKIIDTLWDHREKLKAEK